jgi:23S rRNA G2445 N2-methylase RlmL
MGLGMGVRGLELASHDPASLHSQMWRAEITRPAASISITLQVACMARRIFRLAEAQAIIASRLLMVVIAISFEGEGSSPLLDPMEGS